jgi:hypothetical protein
MLLWRNFAHPVTNGQLENIPQAINMKLSSLAADGMPQKG